MQSLLTRPGQKLANRARYSRSRPAGGIPDAGHAIFGNGWIS